jgi:hypothetical protein
VLLTDDASVQQGCVLRVLRKLMPAVMCKAASMLYVAHMFASHAVVLAALAH